MSNDGRFREGDYVRIQVDAEANGFLLVLQYDPYGRLRVLFPLDPRDDNRVQAGRRYEVRDDGGRYAFRADGDGPGLIFSAIAVEPFRFDDVVADGRWDYSRLAVSESAEDPEPELTQLVQSLAGPSGFDYDLRDYRVYGSTSANTTTVVYRDYVYGDYGFGYDNYCDWRWSYSGCRSFRFGLSFGYDPFYYGYPYRRYYGYNPYRYYYPRGPVVVRPRVPSAIVSGRPRNYTVNPIRTRGSVIAPRPIDWRNRNDSRPAARPTRPGAERREFRGNDRNNGRAVTPQRFEPRARPSFEPRSRPSVAPRGRPSVEPRSRPSVEAPRSRPSVEARSRPEPRSRPSVERSSGGERRGGGVARGSGGSGRSAPRAPSRPRRP
jgi:hypothetical protein